MKIRKSFLSQSIFVLILLLCIQPHSLTAQEPVELFLQVERQNRLKTVRILPGEVFQIRTYNNTDKWQRVRLYDIDVDEQEMITDFGVFHIDDIRSLRTERQDRHGDLLVGLTLTFAAGTALFSLADLIYGNPYNWEFVAVAGGMVGASFLYKLISRAFYYRFDRRHRLRIIDLRLE